MYRGLAKIVGMRVIPTGMTFDEELGTLEEHFDEHDFFFLHYKPADAAGEDGDFNARRCGHWRLLTPVLLACWNCSRMRSWLRAITLRPLS